MYVFGKSRTKLDKLGRVLIPARLRKGLKGEMFVSRVADTIILRECKPGTFAKHFNSLKFTDEELSNLDDLIAEGGMMGNYT
jgi:DNA-binding transcriptional regulator/RsmH inhibitor MraZ